MSSGVAHIGAVGALTTMVSASFTRPADTTAYVSGDAVNNSTSAPVALQFTGAARGIAKSGMIVSGRLVKQGTGTGGTFRLWLFRGTVTPPNDNAAYSIAWADRANRLGYIDFTSWVAGADCAESVGSLSNGTEQPFSDLIANAGDESSLYGILQATAAYTPASGEQFLVELGILKD
jgi:hypothetical protein